MHGFWNAKKKKVTEKKFNYVTNMFHVWQL